jgi:predicted nucleic acid-binding protein
MSGSSYVLDTNIISFFLNGDANLLSYFNYTNIHISFITELELKSIPGLSKNDITSLEAFLQTCIITDINTPIKNAAIAFRKNFKLKLPDAIVAATASYLAYELVTADKVFNKLPIPIIFYSK